MKKKAPAVILVVGLATLMGLLIASLLSSGGNCGSGSPYTSASTHPCPHSTQVLLIVSAGVAALTVVLVFATLALGNRREKRRTASRGGVGGQPDDDPFGPY